MSILVKIQAVSGHGLFEALLRSVEAEKSALGKTANRTPIVGAIVGAIVVE